MFLILNNKIPALSGFHIGSLMSEKDIVSVTNEYVIKCTNALINLPNLEFTKKIYKSLIEFHFVFNDRYYVFPSDIEVDFAIIEYLNLNKDNFILLKKLEGENIDTIEDANNEEEVTELISQADVTENIDTIEDANNEEEVPSKRGRKKKEIAVEEVTELISQADVTEEIK
jgi:hypothetical protein